MRDSEFKRQVSCLFPCFQDQLAEIHSLDFSWSEFLKRFRGASLLTGRTDWATFLHGVYEALHDLACSHLALFLSHYSSLHDFHDPAILNDASFPHRTHIFLPLRLCICCSHYTDHSSLFPTVRSLVSRGLRMWTRNVCFVLTWQPVLPFHSACHAVRRLITHLFVSFRRP